MCVLDDEQLVGPLEQRVDRSAHGALHDVDELLAAQPGLGTDDQRAPAALVVRGERDELENPLDVPLAEAGLLETARGALADEALGARAGVDPGRLDADRAARPGRGRAREAEQRHQLLRTEPGHGRRALERVSSCDLHLGAKRTLPLQDVLGDVRGKPLDQELLAHDDLVDRLLEELGKAGHVDALLHRVEVDGAVDLGRDEHLVPAVPHPHRLLDAGDARARERDPNLGRRSLEILRERLGLGHSRKGSKLVPARGLFHLNSRESRRSLRTRP